jgi:hypothetical protein
MRQLNEKRDKCEAQERSAGVEDYKVGAINRVLLKEDYKVGALIEY